MPADTSVMEAARRILNIDDGVSDEDHHEYLDAVAVARALIRMQESRMAINERVMKLSDTLDRASHSESIHSDVLDAASKELDAISDALSDERGEQKS